MNIQQNINQTLSIAGMLMSQTPIAKAASAAAQEKELDKMRTKQARERYNKAVATAEQAIPEGKKPTEAEYKIYEMAESAATEAAEELFKQDPNPKTAKQLRLSYEGMEEYQKAKEDEMAEKAKKKQEREQNRLARSAIMEGVYHSLTDIPARQAGHEKRLKEGKY